MASFLGSPSRMKNPESKAARITIFFLPFAGQAGTQDASKVVEHPAVKTTEPWETKIGAPGWLAGVNGDFLYRVSMSGAELSLGINF
jgi:hypothetical protein